LNNESVKSRLVGIEICRRLKPALFVFGSRVPKLESLGYFQSSAGADRGLQNRDR
jgi:hypothetical protein